jgi:diguanylate cyclase (GGDEF)-like protein/PAS domain S-box-containing protein
MTNLGQRDLPRMVLEALPLGAYVINREGKIMLWSAGAERLTGYLCQDILGRLREGDLLETEDASNQLPLEQGLQANTQFSLRCKNGHYLAVQLRSFALRDETGTFVGTARIFEGDSPSQSCNRRMEKLGAYGCLDPLTGVLNHSMIQARIKESLNLHALYPVPFSVMCYTVDDLTKLCGRYGQAAVDAALRMVANAFENGLRPTDFLGRLLDQEFLAILPECSENDVVKVGERLRRLVERAGVAWWGDTLHATVSIGATVVHDSDNVSALVGRAEEGLLQSTKMGGNRVVVISA